MVREEGLCVRVWDWSETSQTMLIFTRGLGMVRCVAKGAKRANAPFSGGVEVLTRGELVVSTRAFEKDAQALATLASWDLLETFPAARASVDGFYASMAMLDVVRHAMHDGDPHEGLFDALVESLRGLASEPGDAMLAFLAWRTLHDTGHAPELVLDVVRGGALASAESYAFVPRRGGFTRDGGEVGAPGGASAEAHRGESAGPVWRTRAATLACLREIAMREGVEGAARAGEQAQRNAPTMHRAARLLLLYFCEMFACDPPAISAWLERMGG
jgi:recombinational DNA repair protein (RecF pathway)